MKIGILTLPLHTNYGGILQAWALQTVLEKQCHDVVILNKDRHLSFNYKSVIKFPIRLVRKIMGKTNYLLVEKHFNREIDIKEQYTSKFIKKYINSLYYKEFSEIEFDKFDAVIVGSDQVWSPIHGGNFCGSVINAYLPYTKGLQLKRISYAASFGKDIWEYSKRETKEAKKWIKLFDSVSVREKSGIKLIRKYLDTNAINVIDPTLLLNSEDYIENLNINLVDKSSGNLLVYIIDNSEYKEQIVDIVKTSLKLNPFYVNSRAEDVNSKQFEAKDKIQPPVEKWLRGFYDAEYIVTDSFHACVFSILFKKKFIAIGNKERGMARFIDLLESLGLENRLVPNEGPFSIDLNQKIDYDSVYVRLNELRKSSLNFLIESLK